MSSFTIGSRVTMSGTRNDVDRGTISDMDARTRRAFVTRDLAGGPLGDHYWAPTDSLLHIPPIFDELVALREQVATYERALASVCVDILTSPAVTDTMWCHDSGLSTTNDYIASVLGIDTVTPQGAPSEALLSLAATADYAKKADEVESGSLADALEGSPRQRDSLFQSEMRRRQPFTALPREEDDKGGAR